MTSSQRVALAVGALGAAGGAAHGFGWWSCDHEGIRALFGAGAVVALVPALGLVLALFRRQSDAVAWKIWLSIAAPLGLLNLALAMCFTAIFLNRR